MKLKIFNYLLIGSLLPFYLHAGEVQKNNSISPLAGSWEVVSKGSGPKGNMVSNNTVCITPEQITSGFEQVIIVTASKNPKLSNGDEPPKGGLTCKITEIIRDGSKSSWTSTCETPGGQMPGSGTGLIGSDSANFETVINMKMFFKKMSIKQNITAARIGDCGMLNK